MIHEWQTLSVRQDGPQKCRNCGRWLFDVVTNRCYGLARRPRKTDKNKRGER